MNYKPHLTNVLEFFEEVTNEVREGELVAILVFLKGFW